MTSKSVALFVTLALACSSSSSSGTAAGAVCASDPTQCAAGTTCWPADSVPTLRCLASDPANGAGAACQLAIGQPSCADGLTCDQTSATDGTCAYYCGSDGKVCPAGYDCRKTNVGSASGPTIEICRPSAFEGDDGGDVFPIDGGADDDVLGTGPTDGAVDSGPAQM